MCSIDCEACAGDCGVGVGDCAACLDDADWLTGVDGSRVCVCCMGSSGL